MFLVHYIKLTHIEKHGKTKKTYKAHGFDIEEKFECLCAIN